VSLKVYNLLGENVATLVNKEQNAGSYEVEFNPLADGLNLSSGIYFYRIDVSTGSTNSYSKTKKMLLLR
jgi:hypothetical protein